MDAEARFGRERGGSSSTTSTRSSLQPPSRKTLAPDARALELGWGGGTEDESKRFSLPQGDDARSLMQRYGCLPPYVITCPGRTSTEFKFCRHGGWRNVISGGI